MSTQLENDTSLDDQNFLYHLPQYYRAILRDFRKTISSFVLFHLLFSSILLTQIFSIFFFFSFLSSRSAMLAFALGAFLLTCFTYFILLFYYQAKKPQQLASLKDQFLASCRQHLAMPAGVAQHHLSLADALFKLATYLQDFESNFYQIPRLFFPLSKPIHRFSTYCYREDVFRMKHLLLHAAVEEHLKQIRISPTDLEVHASLANHYVALSRLYKEALIPARRKLAPHFEERFRIFAGLAIEEFRILQHYAPHDPWVHEQLAVGYRDLEMPEEEIQEIEALSKLRPQDLEVLFRLGTLYFQQGQNAKGLSVYEILKQSHYKKAEDLIANYGR